MGRARRGKRGGARLRRTMQTVGAQSSANAVRQRKKKKKKIAPYTAITPQMAAIVIQRWYLDCVLLHRGARSPHRLVVVAVHTVTFARFRRQARGIGLLTHVRAFMEVLGEQRARKSVRQILVYGVFLVAFTAWYGG